MTRALRVITHNWPLKLAAIGLATLLYGGFVLSQSAQTFGPTAIPVTPIGQPDGTYLLNPLDPVTQVRYFAPPGVPRPITSSFVAEADLSGVEPGAGPVAVPVVVRSLDDRIQIIGTEPEFVTVQLDPLKVRTVPVEVERGTVPEGLELGPETADPPSVEVSGPESVVDRVVAARASVVIQPSGVDVDQEVQLVPIDDIGNAVSPVNLEPSSARITIPVISDKQTRSVTVAPVFTGTPPPGFEIVAVTVEPPVVTVEGDIDELAQLVRIDTEPIPVGGATDDFDREVALALPEGVVALDAQSVDVSVEVAPVSGTRSFEAGVRLVGARSDLVYGISTDRVVITIGGGIAALEELDGSTLVVDLDVTGIGPGRSEDVPATVDLPAGLTLVSASPATVRVTVSSPPPPASPAAVPTPTQGGASPSPGNGGGG